MPAPIRPAGSNGAADLRDFDALAQFRTKLRTGAKWDFVVSGMAGVFITACLIFFLGHSCRPYFDSTALDRDCTWHPLGILTGVVAGAFAWAFTYTGLCARRARRVWFG